MSTAKPSRQSSSSEENPPSVVHDRKRKRMESNRESARRSRKRKQQLLDDLVNDAANLKIENSRLESQIDMYTQQYLKVESENSVKRAQVMELADRLQSLNSVLHFMEDFSGMTMDIPEIPDPLLKPWQLPCPAQPLIASANLFQ